jgi:NADPH:quinone reductase-like Zn-dependent oxidoreductase
LKKLEELACLIKAGKVKPVIEKTYYWKELAAARRYKKGTCIW